MQQSADTLYEPYRAALREYAYKEINAVAIKQ